jgi:perosamine synthetase
MVDMDQVNEFAAANGGLWVVEDSAHTVPAAYRTDETSQWKHTGSGLSSVACFSFYANKTITTGEGGMAVTNDAELAARMRLMALHGLSQDAWKRFEDGASWDYRIVAPGHKYNLTDIAASLGIHQLRRADDLHHQRTQIAKAYDKAFEEMDFLETPVVLPNRIHSWHLYPIRLRPDKMNLTRNQVVDFLRKDYQIGCSVHWRPLHLHPYYQESYGWAPDLFPIANNVWATLISLPLFPGMNEEQLKQVVAALAEIGQSPIDYHPHKSK